MVSASSRYGGVNLLSTIGRWPPGCGGGATRGFAWVEVVPVLPDSAGLSNCVASTNGAVGVWSNHLLARKQESGRYGIGIILHAFASLDYASIATERTRR